MTNPVSNIPISADYTSRDYYALRTELIKRVQDRIPQWSGNDPADFGVAMIEAFAYMGDILNYYIDRVANENYIGTATQRQSILELASSLGYTPTGYRASTIGVTLVNNSATEYTLLSGTQFLLDVVCDDEIHQLFFTLTSDVTIPANGTVDTTAINGEYVSSRGENLPQSTNDVAGEWVGSSNGLPDQVFQLSENQVVQGSVRVFVLNGDVYEEWAEVTHITDANPTDAVFYVTTDGDNFVYINFGDGVSGAIPPNLANIKVDYLVGGGVLGNIVAGSIEGIYSSPGLTTGELATISSHLTITNTAGYGGAEPESNDNIRYAAPLFFSTQNRAVTLKDYANLALGVSQVGKTNAVAETPQNVTIFMGPDPDPADPFQYPSYTADPSDGGVLTPSWVTIKSDVISYLSDKTQIGTVVTVAPPAFPNVSATITYTKLPQYTYSQVETSIKLALLNEYGYTNSSFEEVIYPEQVEYILRQVPGVASVQVKSLYRNTDSVGRNILIAEPNEIFVFKQTDLEVLAADALSMLSVTAGTLSPSFNSAITNYTVMLPNSTATVKFTPVTVADTVTSLTVNGQAVASGVLSADILTPVGITTVKVVVVAEDGVTTKEYVVTLTRTA